MISLKKFFVQRYFEDDDDGNGGDDDDDDESALLISLSGLPFPKMKCAARRRVFASPFAWS